MKIKLFKRLLILTGGVFLCCETATTSTLTHAASYNRSEMRSFVRKTLAHYHAYGSVEVIKNGETQQISYGDAIHSKRISNGNSRIVYPTGSIQKIVTGAIIQQLIDQ